MIDLKRFREDKKLTQSDLSSLMQIHQSRISKFEGGNQSKFMKNQFIKFFPDIVTYDDPDYYSKEYLKEEDVVELQRSVIKELRYIIEQQKDVIGAYKAKLKAADGV